MPADGMPDGAQLRVLRALRRAPVRIRRCGVLRGGRAHLVGRGHGRQRGGEGCDQRARVLTFLSTAGLAGVSSYSCTCSRFPSGARVRVLPHVHGDILLAFRHHSQRGERSGLWQGCAGRRFRCTSSPCSPLRVADGRLLPGEYKLAQAAVRRPTRSRLSPRRTTGTSRRTSSPSARRCTGRSGARTAGIRRSFSARVPTFPVECFPNRWRGHAGGGGVLRGGYPGISDVDFGGRAEVRRGEDAR